MKLGRLEDLNASLQQQLLCAKQLLQTPSGQAAVSNQDVIQALKNRIVPQLSEDEVSKMKFRSELKLKASMCVRLEIFQSHLESLLYFNVYIELDRIFTIFRRVHGTHSFRGSVLSDFFSTFQIAPSPFFALFIRVIMLI